MDVVLWKRSSPPPLHLSLADDDSLAPSSDLNEEFAATGINSNAEAVYPEGSNGMMRLMLTTVS